MSRNTDVPATLLGFYYQFLLACKELVLLLNSHDAVTNYVAVEKGADIRVAKQVDNACIEAKFYKDKQFNRNHSSIRHTLFNFYNTFVELKKNNQPLPNFIYRTNVKISDIDKTFFEQWKNISVIRNGEYIQYVKDCIVYEAIQIKPYSDAFEVFKSNKMGNINKAKPTFADYYKLLISELHINPSEYPKYSDVISETEYLAFIQNIHFDFAEEYTKKSFILNKIRNDITQSLQQYDNSLQPSDCEKIRNWIIEEFFDADRVEAISVSDLQNCICNHQRIQLKYADDHIFKKYIMSHDRLIEVFSDAIDKYGFEAEKETMLCCYVDFLEKFYSEAKNTSLDEMCSKYVLDDFEYQPYLIGDLFRSMSILSTMGHINTRDVALTNLTGISNFMLNDTHKYCLMGTSIKDIENDFKSMVNSFIRHVKFHGYIDKIQETEKIVFRTDCKPCNLGTDMEYTLVDIKQVYGNVQEQALFSSLDYRCSGCLALNSENTRDKIDCFMRGNCYGRDIK